MTTSNIRELGPAVAENGYLVCRIAKGHKVPMYKDWPSKPMTAQECEDCATGEDGVGIMCGKGDYPVVAFDFDIDGDEAFAEAMRDKMAELLGEVSVRVGKAPKFLVIARANEAGWRKVKTPMYAKGDLRAQLEILGRGQQFVAYHTHPDTGKPYVWELEDLGAVSPINTPASSLPVVNRATVEEIVNAFMDTASLLGYASQGNGLEFDTFTEDDISIAELTPPKNPVPGVTVAQAREVLQKLKLDLGEGSYDEWIRLGAALHHQFRGDPEALLLWDELSAEFPESYKPGLCEQKWRTFDDSKSGGATFRWYLRQAEFGSEDCKELTQKGLLARYMAHYGSSTAFLPELNVLVGFDPQTQKWDFTKGEAIVAGYIRKLISEVLPKESEKATDEGKEEWAKAITKFIRTCSQKMSATESALLTIIRRTTSINKLRSDFDNRKRFFGVTNGVLDLRTFELHEDAPEYFISRYSKAVYDPTATCPTWERVVREWFNDNDEVVRFVQRLIGSAMTGEPKDDVMGLLRGLGCNGKTSFIAVLSDVFGSYAERVKEETLLGRSGLGQGGQARSDLARLQGARLVVCSETTEGGKLREADIKMITGRDPFPARAPYGKQDIMIVPTWLLLIATNYLPEIKGDDNGIWRRILDIEFPRNFDTDPSVKKDIYLGDKLEAELSGILNWCLEGLRQYREHGLNVPKKVEQAVQEYRKTMDVVQAWMDERTESGGRTSRKEAYQNFRQFMDSEGLYCDLSQRAFSQRMLKKLPSDAKAVVSGVYYYKGFHLRTTEGTAEEDFSCLM